MASAPVRLDEREDQDSRHGAKVLAGSKVGYCLRPQDEIDAGVHLPGIYVQRVLPLTPEQAADKHIERRTVQPKPATANGGSN